MKVIPSIALIAYGLLNPLSTLNAAPPPTASGETVVHEFYADVPWQQKLASYDGNSFTEPFAIPYSGLSRQAKQSCLVDHLDQTDCILKFGIVNIIGFERTDTLYQSNETQQCQSKECVEVKLKVGNYSTQNSGTPEPILFGNANGANPYHGYVISIGSIYAPQLPWYFSHQCSGPLPGNVCYEDYFTDIINTFIQIPNARQIQFPDTLPWYVYNHDVSNRCPGGQTLCTMQLGALDLKPLSASNRLFEKDNDSVISNFNLSLTKSTDQNKFPWPSLTATNYTELFNHSSKNPFLGNFETKDYRPVAQAFGPSHFVYPSKCLLSDLKNNNVDALRQCGINYEIHHGGFMFNEKGEPQWPGSQYLPHLNSYSRTAFMYAGIPGEAMPVSTDSIDDLTIREKLETSSIFTTYMPLVDAGSRFQADNRPYNTEFWHTLYLTNHRIMDVNQFTSGIRGKVLFHDEYRSRNIYVPHDQNKQDQFGSVNYNFAASVDHGEQSQRFSAKTCDACHVRNGSGIPLTIQQNSNVLVVHGADGHDAPFNLTRDYTFTNNLAPMGLRFIDLDPQKNLPFYSNKIMNYYNNMFYVFGNNADGTFGWNLQAITNIEMVDDTARGSYQPKQVTVSYFKTPLDTQTNCQSYFAPLQGQEESWPNACDDVNGAGIMRAISEGKVGFMLLNAPRIVGMNVLEAIPQKQILANQQQQVTRLGSKELAGAPVWLAGSMAGANIKNCQQPDSSDCYIARFGWTLASGTLEDQVSGAAAYPELNITQKEGAQKGLPLRYATPHCGAANANCQKTEANSDLTESHIKNLADYMRWLGVFNRSEFLVTSEPVQRGEKVFIKAQCDTCHVIKKINLDPKDNVLPTGFAKRLEDLTQNGNQPYVSYIGTDLLQHDMGYLSQVAPTPSGQKIRDLDGVIKSEYQNYIQKFRTPPLLNLRFNHLATDSHLNNKNCDFLLHDGRACDALEAAFLHDGPAVKKLDMIAILNSLSAQEKSDLRAFLYSL
jgi:CxxC motif-containing protein (DUF1111 family)